ncbi:uncharacterized protein PHACADRAFT_93295 [Phanerochaete carnosa HHB-10118-sp]|uniref:Uncharacterized protein n=1 Tax=Phanerochaete carnosa (strain HHB-10118-sp) TaxID=650164 RepID=K5WDA9_PHACS|nr:uncharacterized protein PHACADRAFT_93295 [Phanerochaete carnosa HHB-10118-sp]EKM57260.1 hypothetical protein PHACADRAFT_93295 [Phanerochaete carnosa HHB-10118-sp]
MLRIPFWKQTCYSLCIVLNLRGVGWNYQTPYLSPHLTHTRLGFAVSRTLCIIWYIFLANVAQTYAGTNPLFSLLGDLARSMRSQGPLLMLLNVIACTVIFSCTLNLYYNAPALIAVAFRISRLKDWPVVLGRWREAHTVRQFWRYAASLSILHQQDLNCIFHQSYLAWYTSTCQYMRYCGSTTGTFVRAWAASASSDSRPSGHCSSGSLHRGALSSFLGLRQSVCNRYYNTELRWHV